MEKHYQFEHMEPEMEALWEQEHVYRFNPDAAGKLYSIDTPPPTVSGKLHIGHLFSYTQAEMIARFRRMQGYNVFYPFGFDDNGLPTERLVEREKGIRASTVTREEFQQLCGSTARKYEAEFQQLWKSLGFSVDWSLQYTTAGEDVRGISQRLFLELVQQKKAYVKESPVLWCTECGTSIAQAELDTKECTTTFNYIPFRVGARCLEVATTRPELLYGCVCLFVNPQDSRYTHLIGQSASVPLYCYEIPILADEKVDAEKGTGVVMCATFGDSTDAQWYLEHNLPYRKVILPNGRISEEVPHIGGLKVAAARAEILRLLEEKGLLLRSEEISHTVAVHERCGKAVEIIPSRQWYIELLSGKQAFLDAGDKIKWYPPQMKSRYDAWVENLKWDWCISRQRYYGVPFPVWYCKNCGEPVFAKPQDLPVDPSATPYQGICHCGCREFLPETAVLDTWATSSVTPQINERLGVKLNPMSMRTHAHEIIRTWTFYSIVRSLYHKGEIPWKELMISGFVLAKQGEKISKSKGNSALDPKNLIAAHSADALRYWAANARLGTDTFFDPAELSSSKRFLTKLWNAAKFAVSHLGDYTPAHNVTLLPADTWIIERTRACISTAAALLNEYEIGSARHEIDAFFWKDFCDNYVELVKERLYQPDKHGEEARRSGQQALYYTLLNLLKLYAPYVPHITEAVYQAYFRTYEGAASIHSLQWEKPGTPNQTLLDFGEALKAVLFQVRKQKSEQNISMKAELPCLDITCTAAHKVLFQKTELDLQACTHCRAICYVI